MTNDRIKSLEEQLQAIYDIPEDEWDKMSMRKIERLERLEIYLLNQLELEKGDNI